MDKIKVLLGYLIVCIPLLLITIGMLFNSIANITAFSALILVIPCSFIGLQLCFSDYKQYY